MRRLMLIASLALVAGVLVSAALATRDDGSHPSDEPTITTLFGEEPVGLSRRMSDADEAGPASISCGPGLGDMLICTAVGDEDALAALKHGETIYGRNVMGFPKGATTEHNSIPVFESTALVCGELVEGSIPCMPMTASEPTARVGQDVFAYYVKQNVTFTEGGTTVSHIGELTIPLHVVAE